MRRPTRAQVLFAALPTLVVVGALAPAVFSGSHLGELDWDWFFAHYEALRRTILDYHQFPWWNPWVAGGDPLYGDPQVGLVSIQTPFVLAFGTVVGLKLAAALYFVAGLWGMYFLLRHLRCERWLALALSMVFVLSTFATFHFWVGHYTFLLYLLTPWLFLAFVWHDRSRWWFARFGLVAAYFVNAAAHYISLQALVFVAVLALARLVTRGDRLRLAAGYAAAAVLVALLSAPRFYYAYSYVSEYPHASNNGAAPLGTTLRALLVPGQSVNDAQVNGVGWWEFSAYAGIATVALFVAVLCLQVSRLVRRRRPDGRPLLFAACAALAFVLALGTFSPLSPYSLLQHVPIVADLDLPARWLGWTVFFAILAIAATRRLPRWVALVAAVSAVELVALTAAEVRPFDYPAATATPAAAFEQYANYPGPTVVSNGYSAILANRGEIYGYEPMLGVQYQDRPTERCGINQGCPLVSANARVVSWSPDRIELERVGPGPVTLDVNPGSYWLVNGDRVFAADRATELLQRFVITTPASDIVVEIAPRHAWLLVLPPLTVLVLAATGVVAWRRRDRSPPRRREDTPTAR